jgi:hypothetical protein
MRNTYLLNRLEQRIREAMPRRLTPAGEVALAGFLSLTGISRWQPARLGVLELSFVFDIGLPLGLIGDEPSIRPVASAVGDAVCDGRRPDERLWRAVHAAALLRHWGLDVGFDGEPIRVRRPSGAAVEVHVGTAEAPGTLDADALRLRMVDVSGHADRHGEIAAASREAFAASRRLVAVVTFEPRFWVSVEQKEWVFRVSVNPNVETPIRTPPFDRADSRRQVVRVTLLEPAAEER